MRKRAIIFDIDGVICAGKPYRKARPIQKNIDFINSLQGKFRIILWTSRREKDKQLTIEWLKNHNVYYDKIFFGKPLADFYVDDKAISIDVLREVL